MAECQACERTSYITNYPKNVKYDFYEVVITRICNWKCVYCSENCNNEQESIPLENFEDIVKEIPKGEIVRLSGGEIGTMKREDIEYIIDLFKKNENTLHINTNGTFVKKYPDLLHHFDEIIWHVSESLDCERIDESILNAHPNVKPMIVVSDSLMDKLDCFMEKNSDIMLDVVNSTMPECEYTNDLLSVDNIRKLIRKNYKNMTTKSKLIMLGAERGPMIKFY
jgi:organic radical activating enzyme